MSEHALQVAVARMLQLVLDPERTWWTSIDHGAGKLSKYAAGMMKARGVKRGVPDIILMWNKAGTLRDLVGIELKAGKGKLTPEQVFVAERWHVCGFDVFVAHSLEEIQEILDHCGVPMRNRMVLMGGSHERPDGSAVARHPRAQRRGKPKNPVPMV